MSSLSTHEATILIMKVGCTYEVANLAKWAIRHRDQTLTTEARMYFMRAGGTDQEWSRIVETFGSPVPV